MSILEDEVERLRSEILREHQRHSAHSTQLLHCDENVCHAATELLQEQQRVQDAEDVWLALLVSAKQLASDLATSSAERDVSTNKICSVKHEIAGVRSLDQLPRPIHRWVNFSSRMCLLADSRSALAIELELIEEAGSLKSLELEPLLREIEILEVTNTQLRSMVEQPLTSPRSPSKDKAAGGARKLWHWLRGQPLSQQHTTESQANLENSGPDELRVDDVIACSLEARDWRPGVFVKYPEKSLRALCTAARGIFLGEESLLELSAPVNVCGDIHGQYHDLLRLFDSGQHPPLSNYLFLGDYVDRGQQSIESITLLFAYKVRYPENFFLLRGNHECASITRVYGFYDECKRRYSMTLWKEFCTVFDCMPVCGLIEEKIMCMHGGLSPLMEEFEEIRAIMRPQDVPHRGIMCDLLWADPQAGFHGWAPSDRGVSYVFGPDVVQEFVKKHELDLICRAHQVVEDGYEFFADRKLVTVFSAPNYCGEFDNAGAFMSVQADLMCKFVILKPKPHR